MNKRVVITGVGVISSIGKNVKEFWQAALEGKTNVEQIPTHWLYYADFNSKIWSPLSEINFENYNINRVEQKKLDNATKIALSCTLQALNDSNLIVKQKDEKNNSFIIDNIDPQRTAVFIGTGIGGITTLGECFENQILLKNSEKISEIIKKLKEKSLDEFAEELKFIKDKMIYPKRFNPFAVSMIMPNSPAGNIAIKYNLNGANNTFCAACASGTIAIGYAYKSIKNGNYDVIITGGTEYFYDDYGALFYSFDILKTLANNEKFNIDKMNRPFDKERSGFLYSQGGCGILILEELEHALARGANIYAEIIGFSETCDAYNIIAPDEKGIQIEQMFYNALKEAQITSKDIDYINAHGTGTVVNDELEANIIEKIFKNKPYINSTKSLIGHTLGASGAIEAIVTALSIKEKRTHICKNLENPIKELNFVKKVEQIKLNHAITHSFGFGGHNAALVLRTF